MARNRTDDDQNDRPKKRRPKRRSRNPQGNKLVWAIAGVCLLVGIGGAGIIAAVVVRGQRKNAEPEVANNQVPGPGQNGAAAANGPAEVREPKAGSAPAGRTNPTAPNFSAVPRGTVRIPPLAPRVRDIVFARGEDEFTALVSYDVEGGGYAVDVIQTATGKPVGRIKSDIIDERGFALSPKGNVFAVLGNAPNGAVVSLYSVDNGKLFKQFTPYPRRLSVPTDPDAVAMAITSKDQLLTINSEGGFDVWAGAGMQRTAGVVGRLTGSKMVTAGLSTHSPYNFSLTTDGRTLAIFNGTGFSIYSTEAAKEICRTRDVMQQRNTAHFRGAAFSPDGSRFACHYQTFGPGAATALGIWDSKTGQLLASWPARGKTPDGLAWWGSNHIMFWEGESTSASILSAESGQLVGDVKLSDSGRFGMISPNGQLWYVVGPSGVYPTRRTSYLVRADVPVPLGPDSALQLAPDGVRKQ